MPCVVMLSSSPPRTSICSFTAVTDRRSLSTNLAGLQEQDSRYTNPDNDPRGPWQSVTMTISLVGGARVGRDAKTGKSREYL